MRPHELKKRKCAPTICSQAVRPPSGGGLREGGAAEAVALWCVRRQRSLWVWVWEWRFSGMEDLDEWGEPPPLCPMLVWDCQSEWVKWLDVLWLSFLPWWLCPSGGMAVVRVSESGRESRRWNSIVIVAAVEGAGL